MHEADRIKNNVPLPTKKTLSDAFLEWNSIGNGSLTEETTQASNMNIQKHFLEYFGDIKIKNITTKSIREYLAYIVDKKGLSVNTANKHRSHISTIFNYIITEPEEYGIYDNPVKYIKPFKKTKMKYDIFSPEEAKELLMSLNHSNRHDLEVAVNIAFWCGVRREEACGLRWSNVNLDDDIITICEIRTTAKGKIIERNGTKNNVIRQVGITPWFHSILKIEQEHQQRMKELYGAEYNDEDYVFCHDNGKPWHPNSLSNEFHKYLIKNDFKIIRYHDLRHTNLSLLMQKMSAVDVAAWGGHQQVSTTTDIYGHSFNTTIRNSIKYMNEIMDM